MLYSAFSAFMPHSDLLHTDITGSSQIGKTARVAAVLSLFPEDSVVMLTEASPKALYYMARDTDLDQTVIYLDDVRDDHIPLLKTFRNDGPITPRNATVVEGSFVDIPINGRPVLIASSVVPLRDHEQQATSRTFLITVADPTEDEEKAIRKKIRQRLEAGALLSEAEDQERQVLRELSRILRDESIQSVVVPFDAEEPESADRRGTGQFVRLIKISAFINQYQRPILEMKDDSKHVLCIFDDLKAAAELWASFDMAQEYKVSDRAMVILKNLPTNEPNTVDMTGVRHAGTVTEIAKNNEVHKVVKSQKTVSRYLEDLYNNGLVYRKQVSAPGSPWAYWVDDDIRQKAMSEIPIAGGVQKDLGQIETISGCPKYMAKYKPDFLIESVKGFFDNLDTNGSEKVKALKDSDDKVLAEGAEILTKYLSLRRSE